MVVHHSALKGYTTSAETYVRGRPSYPPDAVAWLRQTLALGAGKSVIEVGAGTGKFLPLLMETGAEIIALEPVEAMRAEIAKKFAIHVMGGTASQIGLDDASVDAVVCAQAFHWFATPEALAEMRRVLKPGGVLGLIWNSRDTAIPWVAAMGEIVDAYEGDTPRYHSGNWRQVFPARGFVALRERRAYHTHTGNPEQVIIDRAMSTSFIAALSDDERAQVRRRLRALIEKTPELARQERISVPYLTAMFAYRKEEP